MILDSGLDAACTNHAGNSRPFFTSWITFACYGTGSTVPDATDTSLNSQVGSRSNSAGGFSPTDNAGLDVDTIWYEVTFTRVFSISSNVNATEWGLAAASTGNLSVRELFRADPNDNNSSPITLTLEGGDELQLVITFRVEAVWEYQNKSFVITGTAGNDSNGQHDGNATVTAGADSAIQTISYSLTSAWPGGASGGSNGFLHAWGADQSSRSKTQDATTASFANTGMTPETYVPGDHHRDYTATFNTGQGNGTHYAWAVNPQGTANAAAFRGYRFVLTNPATLTKASTHRLTLTLRKSISRL